MSDRKCSAFGNQITSGRIKARLLGALLSVWLAAPAISARAGDLAFTEKPDAVSVALHKSRIIRLPTRVKKASVGNPEVADLLVIGPKEVYILGKQLGSTNVTLWGNGGGLIQSFDVEVSHDLTSLKKKLHELMPRETIKVFSSQRDVVLAGEISSTPKLDAAVAVAQGFIPKDKQGKPIGKVLPLAQVGGSQQVMLEIKVAEVARKLTRELDFDFNAFAPGSPWQIGAVNGGGSFPNAILDVPLIDPVTGALDRYVSRRVPVSAEDPLYGPFINEFRPDTLTIDDIGIFASYISGDFIFNTVLNAAKNNGLAKILAEPTLTALSGQEARFIAGGEFPIPVAQELGAVSVDYKEFGVGVKFLPVVLDSGLISLQVNIDVSELSNRNAAVVAVPTTNSSYIIPSLTKRAATTSIEVNSGQTIGIAGLISESLRESVDRFPGLGEVPVVGTLFRSQEFLRDETELVIFVTPRLAKPITQDAIRLPTDAFVEPSDMEFYLMGRLEGEKKSIEQTTPAGSGTERGFGHAL